MEVLSILRNIEIFFIAKILETFISELEKVNLIDLSILSEY